MPEWITNFTYKIENQAVQTGLIYKFACSYYQNVIKKEIALANITHIDHILCIGGGICPFSAILFHQLTGAKVTVIDNNESCIPKARQAIERLNISEDVQVFHQDGKSAHLLFTDYSIVHLALQVHPIEQVLCTVKKQISPGTKLLVRRPKKSLSDLYDKLADDVLASAPCVSHKARNIGTTVLYTKPMEVEAS